MQYHSWSEVGKNNEWSNSLALIEKVGESAGQKKTLAYQPIS